MKLTKKKKSEKSIYFVERGVPNNHLNPCVYTQLYDTNLIIIGC